MNNDNELQTMKLQLHSLKQEIEQHTTLHEETLRKQIQSGRTALCKRERASIILVAIVTFLMPPVLYLQGMRLPLCAFTFIFFVFALAWNIYYFNKLQLSHLHECDLITTEMNMQKYRRLNRIWLFFIGLPFILIWMTWYFYEQILHLSLTTGTEPSMKDILILVGAGLVGGIIGGIIGFTKFYIPQMKQAKEIIDYINQLEKD